jgi:hypothetical protein
MEKTTHFIPAEWPGRYRARAVCGAYVDRRDHDIRPTCKECERRQTDYERLDESPRAAGEAR